MTARPARLAQGPRRSAAAAEVESRRWRREERCASADLTTDLDLSQSRFRAKPQGAQGAGCSATANGAAWSYYQLKTWRALEGLRSWFGPAAGNAACCPPKPLPLDSPWAAPAPSPAPTAGVVVRPRTRPRCGFDSRSAAPSQTKAAARPVEGGPGRDRAIKALQKHPARGRSSLKAATWSRISSSHHWFATQQSAPPPPP